MISHSEDDYNDPHTLVWHEMIKAQARYGVNRHTDQENMMILVEEVGEIAKNLTERISPISKNIDFKSLNDNLDYEIVQVAATCFLWLEAIKKRNKGKLRMLDSTKS